MPLYHPPLRLVSTMDKSTQATIEDAINGITWDYFYNGKRLGKNKNVELNVCTSIIDSEEKIYLRPCQYSGEKDTWKEVIKDQLVKHLKDVGVEEGFVKSETRYFDVSTDNHLTIEKYQRKILDLIATAKRTD